MSKKLPVPDPLAAFVDVGSERDEPKVFGHYGVLQMISEMGTDLSAWPTEKHFTAWLGPAPGNNGSGKRKGNVKRHCNRAGRLFRMVAQGLARIKDVALRGFYRRLAARRGGLVAMKRWHASWPSGSANTGFTLTKASDKSH